MCQIALRFRVKGRAHINSITAVKLHCPRLESPDKDRHTVEDEPVQASNTGVKGCLETLQRAYQLTTNITQIKKQMINELSL